MEAVGEVELWRVVGPDGGAQVPDGSLLDGVPTEEEGRREEDDCGVYVLVGTVTGDDQRWVR